MIIFHWFFVVLWLFLLGLTWNSPNLGFIFSEILFVCFEFCIILLYWSISIFSPLIHPFWFLFLSLIILFFTLLFLAFFHSFFQGFVAILKAFESFVFLFGGNLLSFFQGFLIYLYILFFGFLEYYLILLSFLFKSKFRI